MPNYNTYILSVNESDALFTSADRSYLLDMPEIKQISTEFSPVQYDECVFTYHNINYRCGEAELKMIEHVLGSISVKHYSSYQLMMKRQGTIDQIFTSYNYQQALNYLRYDLNRLGDKMPTDFQKEGSKIMHTIDENNVVMWELPVHGDGWPKIVIAHDPKHNKMLVGEIADSVSEFVPYHPANMVDVPPFQDDWLSLVNTIVKENNISNVT